MRTSPLFPIVAAALLAAAPAVRVFAQAETAAAPAAPAPAATESAALADKPAAADAAAKPDAARAAAAKGKDTSGRDTLSVDFPDEDIRNILRNVSDLFELNIILPEALQGKTTIKLRDVTWRQIFQNVLDPVGYTYVEEGNIIKIVNKDTLNEEPVTTDVFLINYARAADILPTITSLVDPTKGKIVVDTRSNSLVITERPTRMSKIRPIVEQLDRATDQVMIESKFVEVTDRDVKNIGVNWASLANYTLGVSGDGKGGVITSAFDRTRGQTGSFGINGNNSNSTNTQNGTTGSSGVTGTNNQTSSANNGNSVTSTNGVPTSSATTGTTNTIGSSTITTNASGTNNATTNTVIESLGLLNSITNTDSTNRVLNAVFSATQFQIVLNALQSQNDVKIVSNPTIVTLNNTTATINVGEERPIPKYQYNQQTGGFEVSGFEYKNIGINLKVTPQVNSRGSIKLLLDPEVSQTNGSATFGPAQIPIVASRKAHTEVSLQDGYTMGIGGLLTTQSTKGNTKVPILGSVPLLGRLFRSDTADTASTNLVIFITAKTLSANGAPVEQVFNSERVRQLQLTREDLPGYRDGSNPFLDSTVPDKKAASGKVEAKK